MSRSVAYASVVFVLLALPLSSQATPVMSVTPNVFAPNSSSKALVCLVASGANLALNNNDMYQAQFDRSVTALSSNDVVQVLGGASGFTAYHSGSIGLVGFLSDGTDMPQSSEACVIVTITTGPEGAGLVQFSTSNGVSGPVPSAQPIAFFPLPIGPQGPPGANGSNGAPGQSVIGTDEPAGSNCAAGGVRYEAASGVNYVCDGLDGAMGSMGAPGAEGPAGPQGPMGSQGELGPKGGGCAVGDSQGSMLVLVVGAFIIALRRRRATLASCGSTRG